jgi:hypothetical protein
MEGADVVRRNKAELFMSQYTFVRKFRSCLCVCDFLTGTMTCCFLFLTVYTIREAKPTDNCMLRCKQHNTLPCSV